MSKQKYLYKARDMVKTRNSEINLIITLIFSVVGLLSFFITPSYSLGWEDEEWLKPGCPKTVSGIWASDNPGNTNLKLLSINNKEFIYISKNDQKHKFGIIKSSSVLENQYIEVKLKPLNNRQRLGIFWMEGKELVIKIRPHLVHTSPKAQKKDSKCLIKIFTFKNEQNAKRDKYSKWNIFRLIK